MGPGFPTSTNRSFVVVPSTVIVSGAVMLVPAFATMAPLAKPSAQVTPTKAKSFFRMAPPSIQ